MQLAPIVPGYPKYEIWMGATLREKIESLVFLVNPLRSTAISVSYTHLTLPTILRV